MLGFNLVEDGFKILSDRFRAFAGVQNSDGPDGHPVGEIGVAL